MNIVAPEHPPNVRRLAAASDAELRALTALLIDCVDGDASVSFLHPLAPAHARAFWEAACAGAGRGERVLLVVEDERGIAGSVQLVLQQPENQPHRADLAKMLVHRRARRRGFGAALLRAAESAARAHGKSLLVLDTANPAAERLYERHGWQRCGVIPGYALMPRGGLCDTTYMYRVLNQDAG